MNLKVLLLSQWTHCQITKLATLNLEITGEVVSGQNNIGIQKNQGILKVWFPRQEIKKKKFDNKLKNKLKYEKQMHF